MLSIAIVGAGFAGLTLVRRLANLNKQVVIHVFDKARRGVGGRMSSRRADSNQSFDFGAQYFTASTPQFQQLVDQWMAQDLVSEMAQGPVVFDGDFVSDSGATCKTSSTRRFRFRPRQSSGPRSLRESLESQHGERVRFHSNVQIKSLEQHQDQWRLVSETKEPIEGGSLFDAVALVIPAEQAANVLEQSQFTKDGREEGIVQLQDTLRTKHRATPCWAVMVSFAGPVELRSRGGATSAFVNDANLSISWVSAQRDDQGATSSAHWVLHCSPAFSQAAFDQPAESVIERALADFRSLLDSEVAATVASKPIHASAHRWRYARSEQPTTAPDQAYFLFNGRLAIGGDWAAGDRVEGAFLSGTVIADRLAKL